jgi:UDP-galactopyranose mutase
MIYTGPLDAYFDYMHGPLPYRSLQFKFVTLSEDWHQSVGTINYPNEYDFTRITEQKYLTGQRLPWTTLVVEYPQAYQPGNINCEPYYPIPREENRAILALYEREVNKLGGTVLFAGRLADYKYYNMDQAVARALKIFDEEIFTKAS